LQMGAAVIHKCDDGRVKLVLDAEHVISLTDVENFASP
jgi:hypothetical protein